MPNPAVNNTTTNSSSIPQNNTSLPPDQSLLLLANQSNNRNTSIAQGGQDSSLYWPNLGGNNNNQNSPFGQGYTPQQLQQQPQQQPIPFSDRLMALQQFFGQLTQNLVLPPGGINSLMWESLNFSNPYSFLANSAPIQIAVAKITENLLGREPTKGDLNNAAIYLGNAARAIAGGHPGSMQIDVTGDGQFNIMDLATYIVRTGSPGNSNTIRTLPSVIG